MLELAAMDLRALADALGDTNPDHEWWFDPRTGELEHWSELIGDELGLGHPAERGLRHVEPIVSGEAYGDMASFVGRVADGRIRERLARAIKGAGAFRRFRDALDHLPDERRAWSAFRDARMERRALEWLADHGDVDRAVAEAAADERREARRPPAIDARSVARAVAADLRTLYGDRLERVILFGSQARGDAHPESDIDLLVVLTDMRSPWEEGRRMDDVLWHHSFENDTVVTALPVRSDRLRPPDRPVLVRALEEGIKLS